MRYVVHVPITMVVATIIPDADNRQQAIRYAVTQTRMNYPAFAIDARRAIVTQEATDDGPYKPVRKSRGGPKTASPPKPVLDRLNGAHAPKTKT